jgi:ferredoxin
VAQVTVRPDGAQIAARDGETVLAALARAGFRYRIGCRRGGCGICKVHLLLGEVRYDKPIAATVLSDSERVKGICLSCRAVPITNVVIELQEGDRLRRLLPYGNVRGNPPAGRPPPPPPGRSRQPTFVEATNSEKEGTMTWA